LAGAIEYETLIANIVIRIIRADGMGILIFFDTKASGRSKRQVSGDWF
jgi:hypothetical protein